MYLSYRERTHLYREKLYEKQLEGYSDVVEALTNFYGAAVGYITAHGHRLDDQTRPGLRAETLDLNQSFHAKWQKWSIFLPDEFNDSLSGFIKLFNGISAPVSVSHQYPAEIVNADDPGRLLANAYSETIEACRKFLGTEPLTEETLAMIGKID